MLDERLLKLDIDNNLYFRRKVSMKPFVCIVCILLSLLICSTYSYDKVAHDSGVNKHTLKGQLLMPVGDGSRGIEVVVTFTDNGTKNKRWLLFDEQGHFADSFNGRIDSVLISTGLRAELLLIETPKLLEKTKSKLIDLGVIELSNLVTERKLSLVAANDLALGDIRIAMIFGQLPKGPNGEPISLGSRQFPPKAIGTETAWLIPKKSKPIYFLVERPIKSAQGIQWQGGQQQLFGPYDNNNLPSELLIQE